MGTSYRPYQPDQAYLLPPSLREWLPEDHLAYFISDTIDALDLRVLYERYEGDGRRNRPYHPAMLLKVLVYCYATGVFSSRRIAAKLVEDVALRVLAAGQPARFSDHQSIPAAASGDVWRVVCGGGAAGAADGPGEVGDGGVGRDESTGQRLQAQGDELREDAGRGAAAGARGAGVAGAGATDRLGRGRAVRRRMPRGRVAGGVTAAGATAGEDPGGEAGAGGRASGAGPDAGTASGGRQGGLGEAVSGRGVEIPAGVWRAAPERRSAISPTRRAGS